jgi:hypothetical protein
MARGDYHDAMEMLTDIIIVEQYSADLYAFRLQAFIACAEQEKRQPSLEILYHIAESDARHLIELEQSAPAFCFAADFCERIGRLE